MNTQTFTLRPFPGQAVPPGLSLSGVIRRQAGILRVEYRLAGPLNRITLPAPAEAAARRWCLWESTCFEFFLGVPGEPGYWEFHFSPAGQWNAFRLIAYRQGIHEERAFSGLTLDVRRRSRELTLQVELEVGRIVKAGQPLEGSPTAVVVLTDGPLTHWAMAHPDREPDFHRRDSFLVRF